MSVKTVVLEDTPNESSGSVNQRDHFNRTGEFSLEPNSQEHT